MGGYVYPMVAAHRYLDVNPGSSMEIVVDWYRWTR